MRSQTRCGGAAIVLRRVTRGTAAPSVPGETTEVADQQQVLEVADRGGQALEALQRLLAPLRVAGAQRGAEQRFQQVRLAVGRGAEDAQVARADADPGELVGG